MEPYPASQADTAGPLRTTWREHSKPTCPKEKRKCSWVSSYFNATSSEGGDQLCAHGASTPLPIPCTHTLKHPVSHTHTHTHLHGHMHTHIHTHPHRLTQGQQGTTPIPGVRRARFCSRCATKSWATLAKALNLSGLQGVKMRGQIRFSLSLPLFRLSAVTFTGPRQSLFSSTSKLPLLV